MQTLAFISLAKKEKNKQTKPDQPNTTFIEEAISTKMGTNRTWN
jgi:hypothetical protein